MDKSTSLFGNSGDKAFYEQLYKENQKYVYNLARYRLFDKNRADDVVQETFLAALRHMEELKTHPNLIGWLIRAAMNLIKEYNQKQMKSREDLHGVIEFADPKTLEENLNTDEIGCLSILNPDDAKLLTMFYIDDMNIRDIAKTLDTKENTVKTRLCRARERLRNMTNRKET